MVLTNAGGRNQSSCHKALARGEEKPFSAMPTGKAFARGGLKRQSCLTHAGWQGLIPSSALPGQADQRPAAAQRVPGVAAEGHGAASKVALVTHLVAELRDAGVLAFNEFKTWSGRNSIGFHQISNSQETLTQEHINIFSLKPFVGQKKHRIDFFFFKMNI